MKSSELALLIDIGSTFTKACAIDLNAEKLLASVETPSTTGTDVCEGVDSVICLLNEAVNQKLDFKLRLASSSAAGGLKMVVVGLVPGLTTHAGKLSALGAGAKVISTYSYKLTPKEQKEIEEQGFSPELKKKIELFNELMRILPVYEEVQQLIDEAAKKVANHVNSLDIDRYSTIHYGPDSEGRTEITVFDKHGQRIFNDPYLDSFLSELYEKEERVIQLVNRQNATLHEIDELYPGAVEWLDDVTIMAPAGVTNNDVLIRYLGKELPWSKGGYSSYFDAKDYKP